MIVKGDKELFATAFEMVNPGNHGFREFHFSYWIGGMEVGNFAFDAPLEEVIDDLRHIIIDKDYRRNDNLFKLPSIQRAKLIDEHLTNAEQHPQDERNVRWSAYNVGYSMGHGYPLEEGSRWIVFYVENQDAGKILCFEERNDKLVYEKFLPVSYFDKVVQETWELLISYNISY